MSIKIPEGMFDSPTGGGDVQDIIYRASERYGIDPEIMVSLAERESSLDPSARNPHTSAGGLFQFVDGTWKDYGMGADKFDPEANADAAARMLKENLERFDGDYDLALAAHHVGPRKARQALADASVGDKDVSTQEWLQDIKKRAGGGAGGGGGGAPAEQSEYDMLKAIASSYGTFEEAPEEAPPQERSWGEAFSDVGRQVGSALGTIPQAVGGAALLLGEMPRNVESRLAEIRDLVGLEPADKIMKNWLSPEASKWFAMAKDIQESTIGEGFAKLSAPRRKERLESQKRIAQAEAEDGQLGGFAASAVEMLKDPEQWLEQAANLAVMGGAGKMAGVGGALVAGGLLQGADVAGDFREKLQKAPPEAFAKNEDYQALVAQGLSPEDAKQAVSDAYTATLFGAAATASVGINRFMPGGMALEKVLAGRLEKASFGTVAKAVAGEAFSEGLEEGPLGQLPANVAERATISPGLDVFSGVGAATGAGFALGGLLGGGSNVTSGVLHNLRMRAQAKAQEQLKAAEDLKAAPDVDTAVQAFERVVQPIGGVPDDPMALLRDAPPEDLAAAIDEAKQATEAYHTGVADLLRNESFAAPEDMSAYAANTTPQERIRHLLTADEASANAILNSLPQEEQEATVEALSNALKGMDENSLRAAGGYSATLALERLQAAKREQGFDKAEGLAARTVAREAEQGILEPTRDLEAERATLLAELSGVNSGAPTTLAEAFARAQPDKQAQLRQEQARVAQMEQAARGQAQTRAGQLADQEAGQFSAVRAEDTAAGEDVLALEETPVENRGTGTIAGQPAAEINDAELRQMAETATGATRNAISHELRTRGLTPQSAARATPAAQAPAGPVTQGQDAASLRVGNILSRQAGDTVTAAVVPSSAIEQAGGAVPIAEARAAEVVAGLFKKKVVWFQGQHMDGARVGEGGFVTPEDPGAIYLNLDSKESAFSVVGHEILHMLKAEHPQAYAALRAVMLADFTANPEKFKRFRTYQNDASLSDEAALEEAIADVFGNQARDKKFWINVFAKIADQHGITKAKSIIQRLRNAIVRLVAAAVDALPQRAGFANFVTNMEAVGTAMEDAAAQYLEALRTGKTRAADAMAFSPARIGPFESRNGAELSQRFQSQATRLTEEGGKFYLEPTGEPKQAQPAPAAGPTGDAQQLREKPSEVPGGVREAPERAEPPSYGTAREGALQVTGTRYGTRPRTTLSAFFYGGGLAGEEAARLRNAPEELRRRLYFYVDSGQGVQPEAGVGSYAHETTLENIYDLTADPLDLVQQDANAMEMAILEAGFDGYLNRNFAPKMGAVVLLGSKHAAVPTAFIGTGPQEATGRTLPEVKVPRHRKVAQALVKAQGLPGGQMEARRWGRLLEATHPDLFRELKAAGLFESDEVLYKDELAGQYMRQAREKFSTTRKPASDVGHRRTQAGAYVGAPPGMTPSKLAALRKLLRKTVIEGEPGRYWYEDSGQGILAAAEGDVARAEKLAGLLAIYSPNSAVSPNTTLALKALYQWLAGEPVQARYAEQDRKAQAWMDGTMGEEDALQIKTGNFFINLMRKVDEGRYGYEKQGATIDMWMARIFGYGKVIGSDARYGFAKREVVRLAKELGWEPQQVQAGLWVAIKARTESVKARAREIGQANGWLKMVVNASGKNWVPINADAREKYESLILKLALDAPLDEKQLKDAAFDFGNALQDRVGQISWEAMPGKTAGVLPEALTAPLAQQAEYLQAIDQALRDENGADLIAKKLGLPLIETVFGPSAWEGAVGAGAQSRMVVSSSREGPKVVLPPATYKLLNAYAAIRGYVLNQEAVVWHYPLHDRSQAANNGVEIQLGRNIDAAGMRELYDAIRQEAGHDEWAPAVIPNGVRVLNFTNTPNKAFHEKIKLALSKLPPEWAGWTLKRFASAGDYIFNDWGKNRHGEGYGSRIRGAGRSDLQKWVDSFLAPRIEVVNRHFAEKYGWSNPAGGSLVRFSSERAGAAGRREGLSQAAAEGLENAVRAIGGEPRAGWAEATRVRGKGGQPLRVFRGAGAGLTARDFRPEALGVASGNPSSGLGVWFTEDSGEATRYGAVAEHFLDLRNFKVYRPDTLPAFNSVEEAHQHAQELRRQGYDGIAVNGRPLGGKVHFVAFEPEQVLIGQGAEWSDAGVKFSPRRAPPPEKTVKAYKLFRVMKSKPGELFPLYVDAATPVPVGQWLDADVGPSAPGGKVKSKLGPLAFRPGWHMGDLPMATHIGEGKPPAHRPVDQVWAEVEVAADRDWQAEATARARRGKDGRIIPATAHITDQIPADGFYRYKTNPNMTGNWIIGGSIKVVRLLSDQEVAAINDAAGAADLPRRMPFDPAAYGFDPAAYGFDPAAYGFGATFSAARSWYYSALEQAFEGAKQDTMPASQWDAWIRSNAAKLGVKADEITWSGITDYLAVKGKAKVTKAEIGAFLRENGVRVEDVVKGENTKAPHYFQWLESRGYTEDTYSVLPSEEKTDLARQYEQDVPVDQMTEFAQYVLPGGENYRELLLTLPRKETAEGLPPGYALVDEGAGRWSFKGPSVSSRLFASREAALGAALRDAGAESLNGVGIQGEYRGPHWGEPNVLAHIRFNDRTDADGAKVLFVEELQSDWGQQGKREGFAGPTIFAVFAKPGAFLKSFDRKADAEAFAEKVSGVVREEARQPGDTAGVFPAPFVTSTQGWLSLALKRVIAYAAAGGYGKVAFVNGAQSAERYDLSKQVREIDYAKSPDGTYDLGVFLEAGGTKQFTGLTEKALEDTVGKEVARKIIDNEGKVIGYPAGAGVLKGVDLKVGGEGMKAFYDQIVPQAANELLKKLGGGRMGEVEIDARTPESESWYAELTDADILRQPGFDITPALKAKATAGLPLFSGARLAPNGKPSKLTAEQYAQVRTPAFKAWFGDFEQASLGQFLNGRVLMTLRTSEAPHQGFAKLREWALGIFRDYGNYANNPELGKVLLDERGIRDSMGHRMSPFKAVAFKAVPEVIERGRVVLHEQQGALDSFYISAPVAIDGADDVVTVLVHRDPKTQRFYLHSVTTKENLLNPKQSGAPSESASDPGAVRSGGVESILRGALRFNQDTVSKATDESGEPRVFYHGSTTAGFTEFMPEAAAKDTNATFFSSRPELARTYSGTLREAELDAEEHSGNYPVFLNIRNPLEHHFEGANWDGDRSWQFEVRDENDEPVYSEDGRAFFDGLTAAEDVAKANPGAQVRRAEMDLESTDSVVAQAKKYGHDGALLLEVRDQGPQADDYDPSDVAVVFSPEQVKSATQNVGTFDPANPDIRFSSGRLGELKRAAALAKGAQRAPAVAALADALVAEPSPGFAVQGDVPTGGFAVLGQQGRAGWRLAYYDPDGLPVGETDFTGKRDAVESLLDVVELDTLRDAMATFSSARTLTVDGVARPRENANGRPIHPTEEGIRNFWLWFAGSKVVDGRGRPLVMIHGTTADFTRFDADFANVEGDQGAGFYFTNTIADASTNYAGLGPDLDVKISVLAERLVANSEDEISEEDAKAVARERFMQHEGAAMPTYLALKNPLILGSDAETYFNYQEEYNEERDEFEEPTGLLVDFANALRAVEQDYQDVLSDVNAEDALAGMWERFSDGASATELIDFLKSGDSGIAYATDEEGHMTVNEVLRQAFQEMGFDGIVDRTVDIKFGSQRRVGQKMVGMAPDTFHAIAFEPEQIKSAIGNQGTFNRQQADIRFSRPRVAVSPTWSLAPPVDPEALKKAFQMPFNRARWRAAGATILDWVVYKLQDKHKDLKAVVKAIGVVADKWNPYLQEELFHGRAAKATHDFVNKELRPLLEELKARGIEVADFETFLWNRHAEERNIQIAKINLAYPDKGSGITTADARAYLAALPVARRAAFDALAKRVDAISAGTRQALVDYDLEDASIIKAWEGAYKHYVPLQRDLDNDWNIEGGAGIGQGYNIRGSASRRATGSAKPVENILANLALQREKAITRGEKNRVGLALYGLALQAPQPDFWAPIRPGSDPAEIQANLLRMGLPPSIAANAAKLPTTPVVDPVTGLVRDAPDTALLQQPNVLVSRVKGQNRYLVLNGQDPNGARMALSLKNLDAQETSGIWQIFRMASRWFSAINTQWNPIFGVVNLVRDVQEAAINLTNTPLSGRQKAIVADTPKALAGIFQDLRAIRAGKPATSQWASLFEEFQRAGAQTGYRDMFATAGDRAKEIQKELRKLSRGPLKQASAGVFELLSDYNEAMENAVRLAAYKAAKDMGMSTPKAASVAKNLTVNFNRKGQIATQAGALYSFFNASAQGASVMVRTLVSPVGKKILTGGLLLGAMQALMLAAAGMDDDEVPEFIKERNLVLPIGKDKYLSLPMPLGYNLLPNAGRMAMELVMSGGDKAGEKLVRMMLLLTETFNPMGTSATLAQTLAPTLADPMVALAENKDWTGKPIAKEDFNSLSPTPGHSRAKDTATSWAKVMSEAFNWMSGGTKYKPGIFSPTPDQIDYLLGQLGGGVARELSKAEQSVTSIVTGEELPTSKVPLVGRFYGRTTGQAQEGGRFYANVKELNQHELEIKGRRKDREPVADYLAENPEARLVGMGNDVERKVAELRKKKRELLAQGAPRERVRLVEDQITGVMQRFNSRVEAVREAD